MRGHGVGVTCAGRWPGNCARYRDQPVGRRPGPPDSLDMGVGFVATQSIRPGDSRVIRDRVQQTTGIFEAWADEEWTIDGASVRVSLICFGKSNTPKYLDGTIVARINSDLSSSIADLTNSKRLVENL